MSSNNFVNFDRSQHDPNIDSAIQQALTDYNTHLNPSHQDSKAQVPIDPSIGTASDKEAAAAAAAAAAVVAADADAFARTTAQAAVNSSKSRVQRPPQIGPKVIKPRVNKPGQKFGAKKKSWVWNWFVQDAEDCNLATCDCCGRVIKRLGSDRGSPKKLGEHLKTHKIDKNAVNPRREEMTVGGTDAHGRYFNALNHTFKPHPLSNEQATSSNTAHATEEIPQTQSANPDIAGLDQDPFSQGKFQKEIMKFLVENKLHLSVVKSKSFRQIIYTLRPSALPCLSELNALYNTLLDVIHNEKDEAVEVPQHVAASRQESEGNVTDLGASTATWALE